VCVSCVVQSVEQGAAAGSTSGAIGLIAAGLSAAGMRGLAGRLVAARFDWVTPRRVKLASAVVAMLVLAVVIQLTADSASPH
jgi:sugar phosphate permease